MYKSNKKKKIILIFLSIIILFFLITTFYPIIKREIYFNKTFDNIYSNLNVKINKKDYKAIKYKDYNCYRLENKNTEIAKLKSKYITIYSSIYCNKSYINYYISDYYEFYVKKGAKELFYLIKHYGFGPYFVNEFIYDKSKGNDFAKIEEIFSKYRTKYKDTVDNYLTFVEVDKAGAGGIVNIDANPNDESKRSEYQKKFASYFSVKRDFEKIDWYEFKKTMNIRPALAFFIDVNKDEMKKIFEEIKPYYNKNEFIIVLLSNDGESIW